MHGKVSSRDRRAAELAGKQRGVIALWQLLELGFTRDMVEWRTRSGRLHCVFRGVYAFTPEITPSARFMAAALAYGPAAVLSHRAAAAIWDLGGWPTRVIDVTVPTRRTSQPGIRIHRANVKRAEKDGYPVTTPTRTLIDLAPSLPLARLEETIERAERLELLDVKALHEHSHGRRGAKRLKAILSDWIEPEPTRSQLERAIRKLCENHNLPLPSQNVSLHGLDVDGYWEEANVVAELDSYEWHRTRRTFERDREKAAALEAKGVRVLRFTWRQITRRPADVAATLRAALAG